MMAVETATVAKARAGASSLPTARPPSRAFVRLLAPEDEVLLTKLLTEPVDYTDHAEFAKRGAVGRLFGGEPKLVCRTATRFVELPDAVTDSVGSGGRVPALSAEHEQHLFKRFNFARRQSARILTDYAGKSLTHAATRRLLAWGHRVLAARSIIVRINMPLVLAMAKRTKLYSVDFNEMISEGNMALLRSVEKFDCSRGFKFSTYSCRAILKSFSRVAMRAGRYRGRFPTEFDPAMERSDHVEKLRIQVKQDCVDELKEILVSNVACLSAVECTVINERFALRGEMIGIDQAPKTLEQVGRIIGVTKERVRQIQNNALKKIRLALEENYLAA